MQHGEIQTIQQFYKLPRDERPDAKDTVFFCTHEPCSLCASRPTLYASSRPRRDLSLTVEGDLRTQACPASPGAAGTPSSTCSPTPIPETRSTFRTTSRSSRKCASSSPSSRRPAKALVADARTPRSQVPRPLGLHARVARRPLLAPAVQPHERLLHVGVVRRAARPGPGRLARQARARGAVERGADRLRRAERDVPKQEGRQGNPDGIDTGRRGSVQRRASCRARGPSARSRASFPRRRPLAEALFLALGHCTASINRSMLQRERAKRYRRRAGAVGAHPCGSRESPGLPLSGVGFCLAASERDASVLRLRERAREEGRERGTHQTPRADAAQLHGPRPSSAWPTPRRSALPPAPPHPHSARPARRPRAAPSRRRARACPPPSLSGRPFARAAAPAGAGAACCTPSSPRAICAVRCPAGASTPPSSSGRPSTSCPATVAVPRAAAPSAPPRVAPCGAASRAPSCAAPSRSFSSA